MVILMGCLIGTLKVWGKTMSDLCPQCNSSLRKGNKYCNRKCYNFHRALDADTPIFTGVLGEEKIK